MRKQFKKLTPHSEGDEGGAVHDAYPLSQGSIHHSTSSQQKCTSLVSPPSLVTSHCSLLPNTAAISWLLNEFN